ncbi:hypothetical protein J4219_00495 [Candidatus Woesearchaeota archaeon]|nr:hypothetical protein [Candidatus Woesearchaeota archaeon]
MANLEEQVQALRARADALYAAKKEFQNRHGVIIGDWDIRGNVHHYQHVSGNFVKVLSNGIAYLRETLYLGQQPDDIILTGVEQATDDLKIYLELLDKYPDYRKKEFENEWGCFPDISMPSEAERPRYVQASAARLAQSQPTSQ